jgi:hypothetical protein
MDFHFPYSSEFSLPPSISGGPPSSPSNVGPTTFLSLPSAPLRLSSRLARTKTTATRDAGAATARGTRRRGRTAATPRRCGTRRRSPPRRRYGGRMRASSTPTAAAACARELHPTAAAEAHSIRTTTSSQYARSGEKTTAAALSYQESKMNYHRFRQRRCHQIQRYLDWKEVKVILRCSCNSNPISFSLIFTMSGTTIGETNPRAQNPHRSRPWWPPWPTRATSLSTPSGEVRLARGLSAPSGEVRLARGSPRARDPRTCSHVRAI